MDKTVISILAGLGGMFGWGTSDFFANSSSEKIGHFRTFFWSQIAGMGMMAVFMLFLSPDFHLTTQTLGLLIAASVLYTAGYLLFYKAFEIGNVSVVSATINLNVVLAIILAYIFLGQRLTNTQLPAVFLILTGVMLVSVNVKDFTKGTISLLAGAKEAIFASCAFGIFWNMSQILSEQIGWLPTTFYVKVISIFMLAAMTLKNKEERAYKRKFKSALPLVGLVGILEAGAIASVNFGLTVGDLVLITPISSALSIVTISLAIIFLKEKVSNNQILGMTLTIVGIVLTGL